MKPPIALLVVALAGVGCRNRAPAVPPPEEAKLPPFEVKKDAPALFTYVDGKGEFVTVDKPDAVPAGARRLVRVVDPTKEAPDRRDTTNVYVVDVDELVKAGKAAAKVLSRQAFETGALAQLPPGESSLLAERPQGDAGLGDGAATPSAAGPPVVTVYGTSWCGACREARRYLSAKKIPFADKDVERDPAAARELKEKAARLGIPTDRVPILDVRGRLLIGFDPQRVEALLGQPS